MENGERMGEGPCMLDIRTIKGCRFMIYQGEMGRLPVGGSISEILMCRGTAELEIPTKWGILEEEDDRKKMCLPFGD